MNIWLVLLLRNLGAYARNVTRCVPLSQFLQAPRRLGELSKVPASYAMSTEPIWLLSISLLWTDTILYANLSVNECEFPLPWYLLVWQTF